MSLLQQCFYINNNIKKQQKILQETAAIGLENFFKTKHPLLSLPEYEEDFIIIDKITKYWKKNFEHLLVFGTGGSNLGAKTLCRLKNIGYNCLKNKPYIHFVDNVDPITFYPLLDSLPWNKTAVLIISKSGETAETICQTYCLLKQINHTHIKNQIYIITSPQNSPLKSLAKKYDIKCLDHDPNLGGRFSVFSIVGTLPASFQGINIRKLRNGASLMLNETKNKMQNSIAAQAAAFNIASLEKNKRSISIIMPYLDQLDQFSRWYRQLWSESIGKEGKGTTPVDALGTVDQHSQIQLYLDGPKDKIFTIITLEKEQYKEKILKIEDPNLSYLNKKTMFKLLQAEANATIQTINDKNLPTRHIKINNLDEEVLGAMMMNSMLETIATASILKVNPFNQPAVELGKILTKKNLLK